MWRATLPGACSSLVEFGLARFAHTPLLPAIVGAHWFPPSTAAYLGLPILRAISPTPFSGGRSQRRFLRRRSCAA